MMRFALPFAFALLVATSADAQPLSGRPMKKPTKFSDVGSVRVEVSPGQLKINAHNPEQEEAQEEIEADTRVDDLAIGFNVNYLLDALSALRDEFVVLQLRDANSSALVREAGSEKCRHVVMPLRL